MTKLREDGLPHFAPRLSALAILAVAAMLVLTAMTPRPTDAGPDAASPRYFQAYPGGASAMIRPEDINAQIKRVAAARGVSADVMRQLVNGREKTGQGIDIRPLNQELDVRWPLK